MSRFKTELASALTCVLSTEARPTVTLLAEPIAPRGVSAGFDGTTRRKFVPSWFRRLAMLMDCAAWIEPPWPLVKSTDASKFEKVLELVIPTKPTLSVVAALIE